MKVEILKSNGKWTVNGKPYSELTFSEKKFFDEFIIAMKWEKECELYDSKNKIAS
jgi:hypothetical protein